MDERPAVQQCGVECQRQRFDGEQPQYGHHNDPQCQCEPVQRKQLGGVVPGEAAIGGRIQLLERILCSQQETAGHQEKGHACPGHFLERSGSHMEERDHQRKDGAPAVDSLNHIGFLVVSFQRWVLK